MKQTLRDFEAEVYDFYEAKRLSYIQWFKETLRETKFRFIFHAP